MKLAQALRGLHLSLFNGLLAAAVLSLSGLFYYSLDASRRSLESEAAHRAVAATQVVTARLDGAIATTRVWFDELERLIQPAELAAATLPPEARLQELDRWIDDIKRRNPSIANLGYLDAAGRAYLLRGPARSNVSLADTDYWQELVRRGAGGQGSLVMSWAYRLKTTGRYGIVQARGIYAPGGELVGAVVLGLHLDHLSQLLLGLEEGEKGTVVLLDDQLRLIARNPPVDPERRLQFVMPRDRGPVDNTYWIKSGVDGAKRIMAMARLKDAPMIVVVGVAEDDFLAAWYAQRRNLAASVLAMLVALGLAGWWAARLSRSDKRVAQAQQLLRGALSMSPVACLHASGPLHAIVDINDAALQALGLSNAGAGGASLATIFADGQALQDMLAEAGQAGGAAARDVELRRDGGTFWASVQIRAVGIQGQAEPSDYLLSLADIDERRTREASLREAAATDALTGLPNRREFYAAADAAIARLDRRRDKLAVLMIDLDHFKRINDSHGHEAGDQVLRAVAQVLGSQLRAPDLAARIGGEEFACLLHGTEPRVAASVAARMLTAIRAVEIGVGAASLRITASMGVANHVHGEASIAGALARADAALYRAKAAGRDRFEAQAEEVPGPAH